METFDPQGEYGLDPRGLIGRIYVLFKYISCGPTGFREDFKIFSQSMETLTTRVGASLDPRGLVDRTYIGDH